MQNAIGRLFKSFFNSIFKNKKEVGAQPLPPPSGNWMQDQMKHIASLSAKDKNYWQKVEDDRANSQMIIDNQHRNIVARRVSTASPSTIVRAIEYVGMKDGDRAVGSLLDWIDDKDTQIRGAVRRVLGSLGIKALAHLVESNNPRAVDIIVELFLNSRDERIFQAALGGLDSMQAHQVMYDEGISWLNASKSTSSPVAFQRECLSKSIQLFLRAGDVRGIDHLLGMVEDSHLRVTQFPLLAGKAAQKLAGNNGEALLQVNLRLLMSNDAALKKELLSSLSETTDKRLIAPLMAMRLEQDKALHYQIIELLKKLGATEQLVRESMLDLVKYRRNDDQKVWKVINTLIILGDPRSIPQVVEALEYGNFRSFSDAYEKLESLGVPRDVLLKYQPKSADEVIDDCISRAKSLDMEYKRERHNPDDEAAVWTVKGYTASYNQILGTIVSSKGTQVIHALNILKELTIDRLGSPSASSLLEKMRRDSTSLR